MSVKRINESCEQFGRVSGDLQKAISDGFAAKSAAERFEAICEAYNSAPEDVRKAITDGMSEEEKHVFLLGCGFYRLMTDETYYKAVERALAEQFLKEAGTWTD